MGGQPGSQRVTGSPDVGARPGMNPGSTTYWLMSWGKSNLCVPQFLIDISYRLNELISVTGSDLVGWNRVFVQVSSGKQV